MNGRLHVCEKEHGVSRRSPVGSDQRTVFAAGSWSVNKRHVAPLGHRASILTPSSYQRTQRENNAVLDSLRSRFFESFAVRLSMSNVVNLRLHWRVPDPWMGLCQ